MELACVLLAKHSESSVRDAVHVATAVANRIAIVVSVDPDFDAFAEVRRLTPGASLG